MSVDLVKDSSDRERQKGLWPGTTEKVYNEVETLATQGVDVQLVQSGLGEHYQLDPQKQIQVNDAIDAWAENEGFSEEFFHPDTFPAAPGWFGARKMAIALHLFYNTGSAKAPSDGIDPDCLSTPIVGERSALDYLEEAHGNNPPKHTAILNKYVQFFEAGDIDEGVDKFGLTFRDYLAGSVDRIADVTRAHVAIDLIKTHIFENSEHFNGRGIVSASLACGAAEPVFWLAKSLQESGQAVDKIHLVDNDAPALAASKSRAAAFDTEELVTLHKEDILLRDFSDYVDPIELRSVDVVDIIGLFEYLPVEKYGIRVASELLKKAATLVRPGGMMVFGNMLDSRPQEDWFKGIWPKLEQRSVEEVLAIIEEAGFNKDQVKIRIPEGEGVYALYSIEVPVEQDDEAVRAAKIGSAVNKLSQPELEALKTELEY